jgi:transcriptional regulator with GAF, ATPase, and Fis domain
MNALETRIQTLIELFEHKKLPEEFDHRFCQALTEVFNAEKASIIQYNPASKTLCFRYSLDMSERDMSELKFRLGEGICGIVALTGKTITVSDVSISPQHSPLVDLYIGKQTHSLLAVPAIYKGKCLAVVEILNKRGSPFDDTDKAWARTFAALYATHLQTTLEEGREQSAFPEYATSIEEPIIICASCSMERVLRLVIKAAPTEWPVLIIGETGTGKELVARRLHSASTRNRKPLITINCAALAETILDSELFGHVKGAFTGADRDRPGRIEEADCGTIFLDEVADMSPRCQAKLLRTLDYGEITPIGSNEIRKVDVRVIAATNRDLEEWVTKGKFRADLYYRLKGIQIDLPPLREREGEVELFADYFLRRVNEKKSFQIKGFSSEALEMMKACSWPGNVRELKRAVENAATFAEGNFIQVEDLPSSIQKEGSLAMYSRGDVLERVVANHDNTKSPEQAKILEVLTATAYPGTGRWNIARAARELDMPRKTLEYKVRKTYQLKK